MSEQLHNLDLWISNQETQINYEQQKHTPHSLYSMLNTLFLPKNEIFDTNLKTLTPTDLHHPDLHVARTFFNFKNTKNLHTLKQA